MPLYEYICEACGRRFEVWQKMGASKEGVLCPQCGASQVKRVLSTFASSVSGSGASCGASASSCSSGFS